jgi:gamma-glutamyltranspeptidase/glutathione hydrolase
MNSLWGLPFSVAVVLWSCSRDTPISEPVCEGYSAAVVCAHPLAAKVGKLALLAGGNAVDAAVAMHFALVVVYPNAGNLGGGGFMLMHMPKAGVHCLDFRETAPQSAHAKLFLDEQGHPQPGLSTESVLAAGVPGSVAGLAEAHRRFGRLPWRLLLLPAVHLAGKGFPITRRQAEELNENQSLFQKFNPRCNPFAIPRAEGWRAGDTLRQPDLARALRCLAEEGPYCFYGGWIADSLVATMQERGGLITRDDLRNYRPVWRTPLKRKVQGFTVWVPPPPSAGGLAVLQMISLLEERPEARLAPHHPEFVKLYMTLSQLAFEDRYRWLADPDFLAVPTDKLLEISYLRQRIAEVRLHEFGPLEDLTEKKAAALKEHTTHFSVADAMGGVVSLTTTINDSYGSRHVVCGAGFLLNNEMDDFSVAPGVKNLYGLPGSPCNAIAPGKRMVSSMTPVIVEKDDRPVLILGTPGGTTIPSTIFLALHWTIFLNRSLERFQTLGRYHYQGVPDVLYHEAGTFADSVREMLAAMGINLKERSPIGRLDALQWREGRWFAAPDPRGDDAAEGW